MSEYDEALDCLIDWTTFWSSPEGRSMFHTLYEMTAKKREQAGETGVDVFQRHEESQRETMLVSLKNAECYYWSPQILDLVKEAAVSLPDTWSLKSQDIPSTSGFFWFARPPREGLKAFSWTTCYYTGLDSGNRVLVPKDGVRWPESNAIVLISFNQPMDPEWPGNRPLMGQDELIFGQDLRDHKLQLVRAANMLNADLKEFEGMDEDAQLFATMLSFIQQRILISSRHSASRSTLRRIAYSGRSADSEVNVVKLRVIVRHAHHGESSEPVDWHCRWFVHGHWRDQYYPSEQCNRPIWITTYLKGPENKPIKDASKVFAVVR